MKASDIIDWYRTFDKNQGVEELLTMRQYLSIAYADMCREIEKAEMTHKELYAKRKIQEAVLPLKYSGTVQEREGNAMKEMEQLRIQEGTVEGILLGLKAHSKGVEAVLNSMASFINVMNR